MKELMKALGKAQSEIPILPKDGYNPYFDSAYTTLSTILKVIEPIYRECGLIVTQLPVGEGSHAGISTVVYHKDSGEELSSTIMIPITGGNPAQQAGSAITYLRRYTLSAIFQLDSDEDIDANSPEQQKKTKSAKKNTKDQTVEEMIKKWWEPRVRKAEEWGIDVDPLPPEPTIEEVTKALDELANKMEKEK